MVLNPREEELRGQAGEERRFDERASGGQVVKQSNLWKDAYYRYIRNKGAVVAAVVFLLFVLYALFWPIVSPYDPYKVEFAEANMRPTLEHPLGTDRFGRDLLTRTALGSRISIAIALAATLVILLVGVVYGAISGFVGGHLDNAMMRLLDALYGLPYLPFAIITLAIIGTVNFWTMVIALSVVSWFTEARIMRGQVITLKENDYVRAARAVGARWHRVLARHLVPNTLGVLIIAIFLSIPNIVLAEAFLSFIGLGISPPNASLGSLAQDGRAVYRVHPYQIIIPSVAIATLVLCANFIADGLRDALDPRTRET